MDPNNLVLSLPSLPVRVASQKAVASRDHLRRSRTPSPSKNQSSRISTSSSVHQLPAPMQQDSQDVSKWTRKGISQPVEGTEVWWFTASMQEGGLCYYDKLSVLEASFTISPPILTMGSQKRKHGVRLPVHDLENIRGVSSQTHLGLTHSYCILKDRLIRC